MCVHMSLGIIAGDIHSVLVGVGVGCLAGSAHCMLCVSACECLHVCGVLGVRCLLGVDGVACGFMNGYG